MRMNKGSVIKALMEDEYNRCCPNNDCHCQLTWTHIGVTPECEIFQCPKCGQKWSVGYELVYSMKRINDKFMEKEK